MKRISFQRLCACGCGEHTKPRNKYIHNHHWRGKTHTKEVKEKLSKTHMGAGNPFYGKKHTEKTKEVMSKKHEGHVVLEETRRKIAEKQKGKDIPEERRKRISATVKKLWADPNQREKYCDSMKGRPGTKGMLGKEHSEETKIRFSEQRTGEGNSNWRGGLSFLPHPPEFNTHLKRKILERDNYKCQNPDCKRISNILHIHHIDYNKKNCNPSNLITLCISCHARTNGSRGYWRSFYKNIIQHKDAERRGLIRRKVHPI